MTKMKVYATLITHKNYLPGLITLNHALTALNHQYPLVALYTSSTPDLESILTALASRDIQAIEVDYLKAKQYPNDTRFDDCWTKLQSFNLTQFERVILLDSDMILLQNIDCLMHLDLKDNVFAASHACVCNPYQKPHYPSNWIPSNCVYSHYHSLTEKLGQDEILGPHCSKGLQMCNGGLLVIQPNLSNYIKIIKTLQSPVSKTYDFADQSLLSDIFANKWLGLSYTFNALKTLAVIHQDVWDISKVRNIHYIISPKPWNVDDLYADETDTFKYWWRANNERLLLEAKSEIENVQ